MWPTGGAKGKVRRSAKSLGFILSAQQISVLNLMSIHHIVVEPFWWKIKLFNSWQRRRKNQCIARVIRINRLGTVNVCTKRQLLRCFSPDPTGGRLCGRLWVSRDKGFTTTVTKGRGARCVCGGLRDPDALTQCCQSQRVKTLLQAPVAEKRSCREIEPQGGGGWRGL